MRLIHERLRAPHTLGQHPRKRLSEHEVEALCNLTDARGDLTRIAAAVKFIQADKRAMYFRYPIYRTIDESCYSTYQSLKPDRKLPY